MRRREVGRLILRIKEVIDLQTVETPFGLKA
jgi:hypothetical protein